jgi:hypothetical protein
MKKKKKVTKPKRKQKIDVVIESLVHLEQRMKELIDRVESLYNQVYYHPEKAIPKKYPYPSTENPCSVSYAYNLASDINRAITNQVEENVK